MNELSGKTTIVVGASCGLGHGVAAEFSEAGVSVVAVSRTTVTAKGPAARMTGVGDPAGRAYAARSGQPLETFLQQIGPHVTPEISGTALVELVQADSDSLAPAYSLTSTGIREVP